MSEGAKRALLKFNESLLDNEEKKTYRKNKKPEEITNSNLKTWFRKNKWSMHRVESKGVYSLAQQRYVKSETDVGFSDWAGCTPNGLGAFVESKAKGKRSNVSDAQHDFLYEKIVRGAFACAVDSHLYLDGVVKKYLSIKSREARIKFLLDELPDKKVDNSDLF